MILGLSQPEDRTRCSARGCRADAAYGLLWNNPKLHTPERRKTWLACEEHRVSLSDFLSMRGFLKDTVPVSQLGVAPGSDSQGRDSQGSDSQGSEPEGSEPEGSEPEGSS